MAFGSWMKKIGEKVKNFGKKVKGVVDKVIPAVKRGIELVDEYVPKIQQYGETVGGSFGDKIGQVTGNVTKWSGQAHRFLDPLPDKK